VLRLAVFASGRGSNLKAIYESIKNGTLHGVELALVISNNSNSGAIVFAQANHIPARHLSQLKYANDAVSFQNELLKVLAEEQIDLVVLAGYMKKLPDVVVGTYRGRVINIHPALLPAFGGAGMFGLHVHNAVIESGKKISGATVHFVEGEYDSGKIIIQETCPVFNDDTAESLAERINRTEHNILPKAIQIVVDSIEENT